MGVRKRRGQVGRRRRWLEDRRREPASTKQQPREMDALLVRALRAGPDVSAEEVARLNHSARLAGLTYPEREATVAHVAHAYLACCAILGLPPNLQ